jgi:hypothetical protein
MNRIAEIRKFVDKIIMRLPNDDEKEQAFIHTYGVAQCCALISCNRGLDTELAYISGLLHDLYAYFTGSYMCHSQSGADMAKVVLNKMNLFSKEEKIIILSAIFYHANKDIVHDQYDEVLKDADILQSFLNDTCSQIFYLDLPRLTKILKELNVSPTPIAYGRNYVVSAKTFRKSLMADIAEELSEKNITGERDNKDFMEIIKYYPEESAFDELKNAWCAAFVYHCALRAGIELPIRQPPVGNRLAGVGSWYEWSKLNNICFYEKDGFVPARGDVVIYNNIIPIENKPKDSLWHDHIGIILSCEENFFVVAEGNINNKNISGIIKRKRDKTIGCFIRLTDGYKYDGWKCDYKSYLNHIL